jgi:serine/threonine protein kinase
LEIKISKDMMEIINQNDINFKSFCEEINPYRIYYSDKAYDLLSKLLDVNPKKRINVQDALKHEFFN